MLGENPTTLVVFGATGDLFRKKLAPALLRLFARGLLPKAFRLVAFSRRPWSDEEFRQFLSDTLREKSADVSRESLTGFLRRVSYTEGDLGNEGSYHTVAEALSALDAEAGVCMNKLFYLATPPSSYEGILNHISASGLAIPCAPTKGGGEAGWTRILIEKPFGSDLETAQKLDRLLAELFSENQIFRIDHYLAKEAFQNIVTLRFSKGPLESLWNSEHIEKVDVRIFEKDGIGSRGAFYDGLGALRDVGQNHALQMAALVGMEHPAHLSAEAVRTERAAALQRFKVVGPVVRGQYEGYRSEAGVVPDSQTETYFKMTLALATPRFKGVPFIIEAGKGLFESRAEIIIHFKKMSAFVCPVGVTCGENSVVFRSESSVAGAQVLDAYERVLLDALRGDQTLFTSTDEVMAEWEIVMPILEKWKGEDSPLTRYKKGAMPETDI